MKDLEHIITEMNSIKTLDELYTFAYNTIDQYTAGKQEQHRAVVRSVKHRVESGIGTKSYREQYGWSEISNLIYSVCLNEKVIK